MSAAAATAEDLRFLEATVANPGDWTYTTRRSERVVDGHAMVDREITVTRLSSGAETLLREAADLAGWAESQLSRRERRDGKDAERGEDILAWLTAEARELARPGIAARLAYSESQMAAAAAAAAQEANRQAAAQAASGCDDDDWAIVRKIDDFTDGSTVEWIRRSAARQLAGYASHPHAVQILRGVLALMPAIGPEAELVDAVMAAID